METKDAVLWLKRIRNRQTGGKEEFDYARREAIDMAIGALQGEGLVVVTHCMDCIYKKHYEDVGDFCLMHQHSIKDETDFCSKGEKYRE